MINYFTVAQFAMTTGVLKGSMYDYFKNKEDIVLKLLEVISLDIKIFIMSKNIAVDCKNMREFDNECGVFLNTIFDTIEVK